jgi:hypothetical protein
MALMPIPIPPPMPMLVPMLMPIVRTEMEWRAARIMVA